MYETFKAHVNFAGVYIAEAHAQDRWPISSARYNGERGPVLLNTPVTDVERCAVAAAYVRNYGFPMPMLVDRVSDEFEALFAPWPIRFYIITPDGKMDFIPGAGVIICGA